MRSGITGPATTVVKHNESELIVRKESDGSFSLEAWDDRNYFYVGRNLSTFALAEIGRSITAIAAKGQPVLTPKVDESQRVDNWVKNAVDSASVIIHKLAAKGWILPDLSHGVTKDLHALLVEGLVAACKVRYTDGLLDAQHADSKPSEILTTETSSLMNAYEIVRQLLEEGSLQRDAKKTTFDLLAKQLYAHYKKGKQVATAMQQGDATVTEVQKDIRVRDVDGRAVVEICVSYAETSTPNRVEVFLDDMLASMTNEQRDKLAEHLNLRERALLCEVCHWFEVREKAQIGGSYFSMIPGLREWWDTNEVSVEWREIREVRRRQREDLFAKADALEAEAKVVREKARAL